jgi:predicted ArsR family transcriptional regulator
MVRGRKPVVSDNRLLLEVFIAATPVFVSDVREHVPIGTEAVRQRLRKLEEEDLIEVQRSNDVSIYRVSESGLSQLTEHLRAEIS